MSLKKFSDKHSFPVRLFHWLNFLVLIIMVYSGLMIYWANDVYKIRLGGKEIFNFFPDEVYKTLNLPYRLAEGMSWHFTFMWLFFLNGLLYVLYVTFSGDWRTLLPGKKSFRNAWLVLLHDLRIRKGKPDQGKYNGAQRIAYSAIVLMGAGLLLSGLVIYKPDQFSGLTTFLGGYESARFIHFVLTIGFVIFFVIHVVQVIMAGWNNFRAMVTGWEITESKEDKNESNE